MPFHSSLEAKQSICLTVSADVVSSDLLRLLLLSAVLSPLAVHPKLAPAFKWRFFRVFTEQQPTFKKPIFVQTSEQDIWNICLF